MHSDVYSNWKTMTDTSETPDQDTSNSITKDEIRTREMQRVVLRKSLRRRRARQDAEDSIWVWLGTFGLVGWTVMVPTLTGLAFGIFLDNHVDSSVSFAITFLIVGVAVGASMAWYWVRQESDRGGET
jgi:ATP synthase protein I